jgi:predicted phosphodiesterase
VSLSDKLADLRRPIESEVDNPQTDWTAGVQWKGDEGSVTTKPMVGNAPPEWHDILRVWDLDPDKFMVVEPVLFNAWDGLGKDGTTVRLRQWKGRVVRRDRSSADVSELISEIKKHKPRKPREISGQGAFVVALSDWQIAKPDGDGTAGIVSRILNSIDAVSERLAELRKLKRPIDEIVVLWCGDAIEGTVGHYATQTFGAELDRRDQIKVARRLLRDALIRWSKDVAAMRVLAVGGNHGEHRNSGGKSWTTLNDNDDVMIVEQVAEVFAANPEAYGHVKFVIPDDSLTVTAKVAKWTLGLTHGHLAKSSGGAEQKARRWFETMAAQRQPIGASDIIVTGHFHHFRLADWGKATWIQAPSMEGGSEWFRLSKGEQAPTGVLTFAVYPERKVADLQIV